MRLKQSEASAHATRAKRPFLLRLSVLSLVGLAVGCSDIPGVPDGGFTPVVYRERDTMGGIARPDPPPVIAGFGSAGAAAVPTLAAGAPAGVTQEMVEEGAQLFGTVCSACHGPGGAGTAAAPSLNDGQWVNISGSFEDIDRIIHTGVPAPVEHPAPMPPLGGGSFNDEQVRALAAYVFALSHQ